MSICVAIEYGKTSPKLLRWLSPDPTAEDNGHFAEVDDNDDSSHSMLGRRNSVYNGDEDDDVAAEARRVEGLADGHLAGDGGEVILNKLRKVYRTKQVIIRTCKHHCCCVSIGLLQ